MRERKPLLDKIAHDFDLTVENIGNFPTDSPSVIVANHTCLRDIFAISAAIPDVTKIVLSSRLMWRANSVETSLRRLMIEQSLHGIPLEVHGGQERLHLGFEMATRALGEGWPVIIFPEGAYTNERVVTKGRTGASRILFGARQQGIEAHLLPVGIEIDSFSDDLDQFTPHGSATINIGTPIDYSEFFDTFTATDDPVKQKAALRAPVDMAMRATAELCGRPYRDEYIEITKRNTIVLESGEEITV